jgi:hypothetical protein
MIALALLSLALIAALYLIYLLTQAEQARRYELDQATARYAMFLGCIRAARIWSELRLSRKN